MTKQYKNIILFITLFLLSACNMPSTPFVQKPTIKKEHTLVVTATAYTSSVCQTDRTPFLAAWNNRLKPSVKSIAVSRDLLALGLTNGTKVQIDGYKHTYTVLDKMNKRWRKKIDIYMGCNRKRAIKWGKRSVTIRWDKTDEEIEKEIIRQEEENSYSISKYILKEWN